MKKLVIFSVLNGFISAFLFVLMGDYFVSERFAKLELSSDMFIGGIALLPMLSSIGFVLIARNQTIGRIWGAFGIESVSSVIFVITDLVFKTMGIPINIFTVSTDDNPALGLLILFADSVYIVFSLLIHIIIGVVFMALSTRKKKQETEKAVLPNL